MLIRVLFAIISTVFIANGRIILEAPLRFDWLTTATTTTTPSRTVKDKSPITNKCIKCLCQVATGCLSNTSCLENRCGAFRITKPYWIDAGNRTINNEHLNSPTAFKNCVFDPDCAAKVIRSYTSRFAKDCNADGVVDDRDYIRIHHNGGYRCNSGFLNPKTEKKIQNCLAFV